MLDFCQRGSVQLVELWHSYPPMLEHIVTALLFFSQRSIMLLLLTCIFSPWARWQSLILWASGWKISWLCERSTCSWSQWFCSVESCSKLYSPGADFVWKLRVDSTCAVCITVAFSWEPCVSMHKGFVKLGMLVWTLQSLKSLKCR